MKTAILLLLTFGVFSTATADDSFGLYLRAVVDKDAGGAVQMKNEDGQEVYVSTKAIITPDDVKSAKVVDGDDAVISFVFTESGQKKLGEATRTLIGKKLAIIIDGKLLSTPVVQSEFSTGANITGNFTREWAEGVVERVNKNPRG